ncbi:hypothetical protein MMC15_006510 [Xylographa vitiligo]|nr:hypothetical protein [Xylographa vitiligo]
MKKLETMALSQLQQTAAGNLPPPMMRTIVQQAIEEYKQLCKSTHPQRMMAPRPPTQAPPYHQLPFQHAAMAHHPQRPRRTPAYPPGLFTPSSAVGGSAPSTAGSSAQSTSQTQRTPAYPSGLSRPNSAGGSNALSAVQLQQMLAYLSGHPRLSSSTSTVRSSAQSALQPQHTPDHSPGLSPPKCAVGVSAPSTSQHQHTADLPPGLSPPTVKDSAPSTAQYTASRPIENSPPNSVAGASPSSASQHDPAPQVLTPPITPTTPTTRNRNPPVPRRPSALMALIQNSDPIRAPSRLITANGTFHGYMDSRSALSTYGFEYNPRLPNSRVMHVFMPPQKVFNPIGGPRG